jgi:hypothetical protein
MNKFVAFLSIIITTLLFAACQKELRFEPLPPSGDAQGILKMNAAGTCLPQSISGAYIKDTVLNTANFIEVAVEVTKTGRYKISTDTIDGFYFSDSGTFNRIQTETIILKGKGTPTSLGLKQFTVKFGNSTSCKIAINVTTAGTSNPIAVFSITNCGSPVLSGGPFVAGTPSNAIQTVMFSVTVTNIGLYNITSTSNNGLTFTASGSYNGTGSNTVILTPTGTPTAAGTFNYTISTGTSSCTFPITVTTGTPPPPPTNLDYIPMTTNTNWTTLRLGGTPTDTSFIQVSPNQKIFGANSYFIFERTVSGTPQDSTFFRKNGGLYYQYISGTIAGTPVPITQEYLVLDSNKLVNQTWVNNFGNVVVMGIPLSNVTVTAKILAKGATETVQTISYSNVIKVEYKYTASIFGLPTDLATEERWYSKGKGVIKSSVNIVFQGGGTIENELIRSQIF